MHTTNSNNISLGKITTFLVQACRPDQKSNEPYN